MKVGGKIKIKLSIDSIKDIDKGENNLCACGKQMITILINFYFILS
jgi:hypothetical protein